MNKHTWGVIQDYMQMILPLARFFTGCFVYLVKAAMWRGWHKKHKNHLILRQESLSWMWLSTYTFSAQPRQPEVLALLYIRGKGL